MSAYHREMDHARRDARELAALLVAGSLDELTTLHLMTAIGLASMAREALMRAAAARETETPT